MLPAVQEHFWRRTGRRRWIDYEVFPGAEHSWIIQQGPKTEGDDMIKAFIAVNPGVATVGARAMPMAWLPAGGCAVGVTVEVHGVPDETQTAPVIRRNPRTMNHRRSALDQCQSFIELSCSRRPHGVAQILGLSGHIRAESCHIQVKLERETSSVCSKKFPPMAGGRVRYVRP